MTGAEIMAAVNLVAAAIKEYPELAHAIEGVFTAYRTKTDPTQAEKHLEAVAAAAALGISYP